MRKSSTCSLARPASLLALCLVAGALAGCAQSGRSTMGGPSDPAAAEERQRARGSIHPMPPGQNMPGGGEASGGGADGGSGGAREGVNPAAPGQQ